MVGSVVAETREDSNGMFVGLGADFSHTPWGACKLASFEFAKSQHNKEFTDVELAAAIAMFTSLDPLLNQVGDRTLETHLALRLL